MNKSFIVTETSSGRKFIGESKRSWNRTYYRFDEGTWYRSRSDAFNAAKSSDTLWEIKQVTPNAIRKADQRERINARLAALRAKYPTPSRAEEERLERRDRN